MPPNIEITINVNPPDMSDAEWAKLEPLIREALHRNNPTVEDKQWATFLEGVRDSIPGIKRWWNRYMCFFATERLRLELANKATYSFIRQFWLWRVRESVEDKVLTERTEG